MLTYIPLDIGLAFKHFNWHIVYIGGTLWIFEYMYTTYNDQIRVVGISITSNIYYFFVLGIFKIFSTIDFEIFN
jgi:hypothetical protein